MRGPGFLDRRPGRWNSALLTPPRVPASRLLRFWSARLTLWAASSGRRRGSGDILLPTVRLALGRFPLSTGLRRKSTSTLRSQRSAGVTRRARRGRPRSPRRRSSAAELGDRRPRCGWVRSAPASQPASRPPWSSGVVCPFWPLRWMCRPPPLFQFSNQNTSILSVCLMHRDTGLLGFEDLMDCSRKEASHKHGMESVKKGKKALESGRPKPGQLLSSVN